MDHNLEERDIYSEQGREKLVEDDAIEPWEDGFMRGAEGLSDDAKCKQCRDVFIGPDSVIEIEINGETLRFCSEECVKKYKENLLE